MEALRAFERGDFAEAGRLARALRDSGDAQERQLARTVLLRLAPDPLIVALTVGCGLFLLLLLYFTVVRG